MDIGMLFGALAFCGLLFWVGNWHYDKHQMRKYRRENPDAGDSKWGTDADDHGFPYTAKIDDEDAEK